LCSLSVGAAAVELIVVVITFGRVTMVGITLTLSLISSSHVAAVLLSFFIIILTGHLAILLLLLQLHAVLISELLFDLSNSSDVVLRLKESGRVDLARIGVDPLRVVLWTVVLVNSSLNKFDINHFV
jgi:hypothetical protein